MKKSIKAQWIAAMQSGEYVFQGYALRSRITEDEFAYSAFGVLADLFIVLNRSKARWEDSPKEAAASTVFVYESGALKCIARAGLPSVVAVWAGVDTLSVSVVSQICQKSTNYEAVIKELQTWPDDEEEEPVVSEVVTSVQAHRKMPVYIDQYPYPTAFDFQIVDIWPAGAGKGTTVYLDNPSDATREYMKYISMWGGASAVHAFDIAGVQTSVNGWELGSDELKMFKLLAKKTKEHRDPDIYQGEL